MVNEVPGSRRKQIAEFILKIPQFYVMPETTYSHHDISPPPEMDPSALVARPTSPATKT